LTPLLTNLVARELRALVLSSRLSHISQTSPDIVHLTLYHPDRQSHHLVFALLPQKPLVFLTTAKLQSLAHPPNFSRSLRKQLEYAQLVEIADEPGERILHFFLKTPGGMHRLVFEGIPKYPNLILVGPDHGIISALRYKNDVERPVLPGSPYAPPPHGSHLKVDMREGAGPPSSHDKPNFWKVDEETIHHSWEAAGRPPFGPWLKNGFWGVDPELAEFLGEAGMDAFQKWRDLKKELSGQGLSQFFVQAGPPPALFTLKKPDFPKGEIQTLPTANRALERLFQLENHYREFSMARTKLESEITKALKHEKRILEKLKKDRADAERSDQYQWWGELLMALLHKGKPHLKQVDLEDVVRGTKTTVAIPLDPESTPLQNAQRFFKKAQKGSRGLAQVEKREGEIKGRLEQLKAAQRSLPALQSPEEIRKAGQDLFPKARETSAKPAKAKVEKIPTPNILREKLSKQFEVCAGTSAAANEYVTFQLAQPEDLWFHVRDLPGSHVVLRRLQRDAPYTDEVVLHAARLAASHSKAKPGSKVTVSYTEKKYVKRIPGAPMGMVSMSKERSLLVEI